VPITSILEIQLKPDAVEEGLAIFARALVDTRAFEGCVSVVVVQDQGDPARIAAIETWESLEADTAYRAWRAGDGRIEGMPGVLAAAPRLLVGVPVEGA
jgi:quinol monooxygenase YgiN